MINTYTLLQEFVNHKNKLSWLGWDLIVVGALDQNQAQGYMKILKTKYTEPEDHKIIRVYYDPPGQKIGSGGATIHALKQLHDEFGNLLFEKRIFYIPAGGFSQRMPTLSVLGKLFLQLPTIFGALDSFDLKLALTIPISRKMPPGLFLTAPDALEPYSVRSLDEVNFGEHFTATAHYCSDLKLASGHGVYVKSKTRNTECRRVLQKPTEQEMRNANAIFMNDHDQECVLIDSQFAFTHSITRRLLTWLTANAIDCEIDAYGDFLQPLGSDSTPEYIENTRTVVSVEKTLMLRRREIYNLLHDASLHLCVLKNSKFFHLGSSTEYLHNLCSCQHFQNELFLQKYCDCLNSENCKVQIDGYAIRCSFRGSSVSVNKGSIVEFSKFECDLTVETGCIVSNCWMDEQKPAVHIPADIVIQTIPININNEMLYVTIMWSRHENIKETVSRDVASTQLKYCGKPLKDFIGTSLSIDEVFPSSQKQVRLWSAELFPAIKGAGASLRLALDLLNGRDYLENWSQRLSMQDLQQCKDVNEMIRWRDSICK